ncbi:MAG: protein kinase, partial [Chloroflexi bacterium]|nr:protein kinase [Chloroflexota bacterium]
METEVRSLTEAIEGGRADADTYQLRASYLVELDRLDEAEVDLEHVTDPACRDLLQADIAAARGHLREACDLYESVLADNPGRASVARKLSRLYVQQGSFNPEEIRFVRETLDAQPDRLAGSGDWVKWVTFLHDRYAATGEWDLELGLLRKVAERNPLPSNPKLGLWMVDALQAQGSIDEAAALLTQLPVAGGHPSSDLARRHVARALIDAGRNAAARTILAELAAAGSDPKVTALLSMLERAAENQRFVPIEKVGSGAVAEVWKAFDLQSGDLIGLKILHPAIAAEPGARDELQREFEVMSSSLSPRLARTIPGTLLEDRFAMELLDESLVDVLNDPANARGLPLFRAVEIAQQVAEGLDYLHARGLVYQDLSPQNVLFRGSDVKLCDLGGFDEGAAMLAGATVAKVAYASPEQCALLMGESGTMVDRRSDIYSLGVVLYQMLTGRLPFEGPDQAVLHAHLYS